MRLNHGLLFWGLGLLTAGLVALAVQQNVLDRDVMANAWRLWPLILVAIGLSLILSRTGYALVGTAVSAIVIGAIVGTAIVVGPAAAISCASGDDPSALTDHGGSFGGTASLDWQLNCGTLEVDMTAENAWTASVGSVSGNQPTVTSASDELRLASVDKGFFAGGGRERWVVRLPAATTYDADLQVNGGKATMNLTGSRFSTLSFQPNAADVHLDLSNATVTDLDLELNAGSAVITASSGTNIEGRIQENAGSVRLCVPSGVGLRITATGVAFGTNLDQSGLSRNGDTWVSSDFGSAYQKITLTVEGNAGSFDLNPSGGC